MCKINYIQYNLLTVWQLIHSQPLNSDQRKPNSQILQSLQNSWKRPNSWRSSNSWKREDSKPTENEREKIPAPQPTPIHKRSITSMVWNISIGQLGLAAWLWSLPAPAHLLLSSVWETGKSPWFHSKNWKH